MKLSVQELLNIVDEYAKNEKEVHFLVKGDIACILQGYVEREYDIYQFTEGDEDYLDEFNPNELYWFDLAYDAYKNEDGYYDYVYYVQEAFHKGILLSNDEEDTVYLDSRFKLSTEARKRVKGKVIEFEVTDIDSYIEDVDEEEECNCNYCLSERISALEDENAYLKDEIKKLKDSIVKEEKQYTSSKDTKVSTPQNKSKSTKKYYINDEEVTEEEYNKYYDKLFKEAEREIDRIGQRWINYWNSIPYLIL